MKILVTPKQYTMLKEGFTDVDVIDPNEYSGKLIAETKSLIVRMIDNLQELNEMGYDFTKEYKLTGKQIYGKVVDQIDATVPKMMEDLKEYSIKLSQLSSNIKRIYV
jgi:hypothetical protein